MKVLENHPLLNLNSMKTEAFAKYFSEPCSVEEIQKLLESYEHEPILILGGGCNTFFTKNFNGLVIRPKLEGIHICTETGGEVQIEAQAGEDWDAFVKHTVAQNFSGLENLSLIPGTVGAAPVQNIGAYGTEVKDTIVKVNAIDRKTAECVSFTNAECEFGYRSSIFKYTEDYIITSVVFRLKKVDGNFEYIPKYEDLNRELETVKHPSLRDVREAVINIRKRKLPDEKVLPNSGSFFKNPLVSASTAEKLKQLHPDISLYPQANGFFKTSAAFLIDRAGYKNKRVGNVGTYQNQPLVIVNYGTTDGNEIVQFMKDVQEAVFNKYGIVLEPEVRIY